MKQVQVVVKIGIEPRCQTPLTDIAEPSVGEKVANDVKISEDTDVFVRDD